MLGTNKRKDLLLGEPHGTASGKLRKMLLFKYVQLAGHDVCYRCSRKIESVSDISIEHKTSWQLAAAPRSAFFNLGDIVFSHLRCNVEASNRFVPPRKEHGSSGYARGCKCTVCRGWKSGQNAKRPTTEAERRKSPVGAVG